MPSMLILGGVDVPLINRSLETSYTNLGATTRAFDGTLRVTTRATKRSWRCMTQPLSVTTVNTLQAMHGTVQSATIYNAGATVNVHVSISRRVETLQDYIQLELTLTEK